MTELATLVKDWKTARASGISWNTEKISIREVTEVSFRGS
jgi:hypothetical protein